MATPLIKDRLQWPLLAVTTACGTAIFFYQQLTHGFARLFGDHYDGFIELSIMQHWNNVLHGVDVWNVTGYFYPNADTLGYNDGYFVYGLLYTLFRTLNADTFLAGELVHMTIKASGTVGMYFLLRFCVGCRIGWSLLGALVFTIACSSVIQAGHAQLLLVAFTPTAAFLGWSFFKALLGHDAQRVYIFGTVFSVFYGAWLLTAYYMAWYFGLLTTVICAVAMVCIGRDGRSELWERIRKLHKPVTVAAIAFVVSLTPFLIVYLPKMRETGGHGWRNTLYYALHPLDVVNVGPDNLVWGNAFHWLHATLTPKADAASEFAVGVPPAILALAIAGMVVALRGERRRPLFWCAIAVIATWLMAFNYGKPGSFSPWELVFRFFPGGSGTRVIARYQIFMMLPVVAFAMKFLDGLGTRAARVAVAASAFLVLEEVVTAPPTFMDRAAELDMLARIPPVPATCKSFYVVSARTTPYGESPADLIYSHNVDAMVLSAELARPTMNGFSTFTPKDWSFANPSAPDYHERAATYARNHGLHGVCSLDILHGKGWVLLTRAAL